MKWDFTCYVPKVNEAVSYDECIFLYALLFLLTATILWPALGLFFKRLKECIQPAVVWLTEHSGSGLVLFVMIAGGLTNAPLGSGLVYNTFEV